jgi:hypothetical protein
VMDELTSNMIDDFCGMERAISNWPHGTGRDAHGLPITHETLSAAWEEFTRLYSLAGGDERFHV